MVQTRKAAILTLLSTLLISFSLSAQPSRHVILISIDGLHPDMYLDSAWPTPNLRQLMKAGTYADHLKSVFPAYTYPSHTAMITGALPARSHIIFNQPIGSKGEWYWFMDSIKVPTLWQALKARNLTTASVEWPCSVMAHTGDITWNLPEIWDPHSAGDRIATARRWATPGLIDELERNATGKLDSTNMNDDWLSLDENSGRIAAYIFKTYRPAFMALHFACVDGAEHEHGRDGDSVRLAVESNDRAIGDLLEAIQQSGLKDSTTVIVVGDHGFCTIHTIMRPNMLIKDLPARFIAAGGSAFLYKQRERPGTVAAVTSDRAATTQHLVDSVIARLNNLPPDKRKLFRIIDRNELDRMGADSNAVLALAAVPGIVFSGSTGAAKTTNLGPGTLIQQSGLEGVFIPTHGGHHGYDPDLPDMWTGFIAAGAGIRTGGRITRLGEQDLAPLIAALLGIEFTTPDGHLIPGILK